MQASESELVQRACHAATALVQHVGVDHRGRHIGMAEQFLHGTDVVAAFEQVGCEGVAQRVDADGLVQSGGFNRALDRTLQAPLIKVMPPPDARYRIDRQMVGRP